MDSKIIAILRVLKSWKIVVSVGKYRVQSIQRIITSSCHAQSAISNAPCVFDNWLTRLGLLKVASCSPINFKMKLKPAKFTHIMK